MDLFILIITLLILAETTIILVRKNRLTTSKSKRRIYVDTSVLIDGRIVNIARTGFIDGDLIVLKSVLRELQLLADSKDGEKRTRARLGLESVSELERVEEVNTEIEDDGKARVKVDEQLLEYARKNNGAVLTLDYNLIKVAEAEKIETLNINDLALAVRAEFLLGEKVRVKVSERGNGKGQGIAHLPSGTMVIVEKASGMIGKELTVELVRVFENSAGKIFFAKIADENR